MILRLGKIVFSAYSKLKATCCYEKVYQLYMLTHILSASHISIVYFKYI